MLSVGVWFVELVIILDNSFSIQFNSCRCVCGSVATPTPIANMYEVHLSN